MDDDELFRAEISPTSRSVDQASERTALDRPQSRPAKIAAIACPLTPVLYAAGRPSRLTSRILSDLCSFDPSKINVVTYSRLQLHV